MKKFTQTITCLSVAVLFAAPTMASELSWKQSAHNYMKEFKSGNYQNLSAFHGIISVCESLPEDSAELEHWIATNAPADGEQARLFERNVRSCKNIEKKGYKGLTKLYREAVKSGSAQAALLLAGSIPYNSTEKMELLKGVATQSVEAVNLLAYAAVAGDEVLPTSEQYFWISVSDLKLDVNEQPEPRLAALESELTADAYERLTELVTQWSEEGDREQVLQQLLAMSSE